MMRPHNYVSVMALVLLAAGSAPAAAQGASTTACKIDGQLASMGPLNEASGLAMSRRDPNRLWTHNDSGEPMLFAVDTRGKVTAQVRLTGIAIDDWEAIAVGACPGGSCVYVGDIGDNDAKRKRITIHRFPEPAGADTSAAVKETFYATYPDGAHDAETLLATDGGLFIVTKGDTGEIALYRFPRELRPGANHQLERVGKARGSAKPGPNDRVTDGTVSVDGQWIVLRTNTAMTFHKPAELLAGNWRTATTVDLSSAGETQGEGVAMDANNMVYLAGEGGSKSRPGTLARLACTFAD